MRLYSLAGAIAHEDPDYGHFEAGDDGSFAFPDDVSDVLVTCAIRGRKLWETEEARAERMHGLEMARRRDPASVLTAMEENQALVRQLAQLTAQLTAMQLAQGAPAPAPAAPAPEPAAGVPAEATAEVPEVPAGTPSPALPARSSKSTPRTAKAGTPPA